MPRRFEREEEHSRERGDRGSRPPAVKKSCRFCANPFDPIDYKNERQVRRLVSERGKILPRRATGNCAKHQREAAIAVKYARHLAILPFVSEFHK